MIALMLAWAAFAQDPEPPPPVKLSVEMTEFSVAPLQLDIPAGKRIRLAVTNTGTVTHSLRIPELHVATDALQPGETQVLFFTAREPGRFAYTCGISGHDQVGVAGKLVVDGAPVASPSASIPSRESPTDATVAPTPTSIAP